MLYNGEKKEERKRRKNRRKKEKIINYKKINKSKITLKNK